MGFIGTGNQGTADMRSFLNDARVQVIAVCDVNSESAGYWNGAVAGREPARRRADEAYAERIKNGTYSGCRAYVDYRELLAREDIDAVEVATPDHWHALQVIDSCRAGKDVYCQKPESLTIREGRAMVQAARQYGRVFSGGSQRVHEDYIRTVKQCWSGEIGTPKEVYVNCGGPSKPCYLPGMPVPAGVDWDFWLGPAPWAPYRQ